MTKAIHQLFLARLLAAAILVFANCAAAQQSNSSAPASPPAPAVQNPGTPLLVGPGDLLHITVLGAPDFERDARVAENGMLSLPMVGDVKVAGLAAADAQTVLAKKLSDGGFFVDPQVSILIKEYATQGISVLGEVQKPGIYPLLGEHTLYDAISAAGGTTPRAGQVVTITRRNRQQKQETVKLAHDSVSDGTANVPVYPGDTVVVSKAGMVYVVGDVRQPTGIVLDNPELTVMQAIAIAQGTNFTAALDHVRVIRRTAAGVQEIPVPYKKILSAKAADVRLIADDVLFVPGSAAKSVARRSLEAIVQTATGVAIYRR